MGFLGLTEICPTHITCRLAMDTVIAYVTFYQPAQKTDDKLSDENDEISHFKTAV